MEADPSTVLEWLECSEARELQLTALEQLCNDTLFSDNINTFQERYKLRSFIPTMLKIFSDDHAPDDLLEACARTLTYCVEMTKGYTSETIKINDLKVICMRLDTVDMMSDKSNEVGQQIVKVCSYVQLVFKVMLLLNCICGLTDILSQIKLKFFIY